MKGSFRLTGVVACVLLLALLAGCNGQTPPSMREDSTPSATNAAPAEQSAEQPSETPSEATTSPTAAETTESAATESKPAESKPAESAEKRTQYEGSLTSAAVAVGAELQRTADWKIGGKLWAMTLDGKADASGKQPVVQLVAVAGDNRSVIAEIKGDVAAATIQGNTIVGVPAGTTALIVTTNLSPSGKPGPSLTVPLADVPEVKEFTLVKAGE